MSRAWSRLRREDALLLVVDVQQKLAPAVHESGRVIRRCAALIRAATLLGVPVLVSEHCPDAIGATVPELSAVAPADSRMRKVFFSCADQPECLQRIESAGRRQIVIAGMEAHVCVIQSALGLGERGFQCFVVQDSTGSRRPEDHSGAIERLRAAGAQIVTAEMAMFEWLHRADLPEWRQLLAIVKEA